MIQYGGLTLEGVSMCQGIMYKAPDGSIRQGHGIYVKGAGNEVSHAGFIFPVTGEVALIGATEIALTDSLIYTGFYGSVVPVGSTVYLSTVPLDGEINYTALKAGVIYETVSDAEGAFTFQGVENTLGRVIAWTKLPAQLSYAEDASLTLEAVMSGGEDTPIQRVLVLADHADHHQTCSNCGGTGKIGDTDCEQCGGVGTWDPNGSYPGITISGNCPTDAGVIKLSAIDDQNADIVALSQAQVSFCPTGGEGVYQSDEYKSTTSYWGTYTVWCESAQEGLTCDIETSYNMCLSGDTLITMADGSRKRLDKLRPGDRVLSGSGKPALVVKLARGAFNSHHTLYHFSDGTVIDEVDDHRFYNIEQGFWQKLKFWKIGEHAKRQDGELVELVRVERIGERAEKFGLWTSSHDYWANGLLSGETIANLPLLANAAAEKAVNMAMSLQETLFRKIMGLGDMLP